MTNPNQMTRAALQQAVDAIPHWFHSLDLGQGVVTPGDKSPGLLQAQLKALQLPDLTGKTVLDIGAWDGYFTWAAERLGAQRVVSVDHFVWALNRTRATALKERWQREGTPPRPFEETDAWEPDTLPGKRGYDLAHKALQSRAEWYVADFMEVDFTADLDGPFDVVLWLGVLYHMRHPLLALEKVAAATRELAIIETEAFMLPRYEQEALCQFFERDELAGDFTNWWSPNEKALVGMVRAAGFRRIEIVQGASEVAAWQPPVQRALWGKIRHAGRHVLHELGLLALPPDILAQKPPLTRYRAIIHAWK